MLADLARDGYRGWVVYLDADAFVADLAFDLRSYFQENEVFVLMGGPAAPASWAINAGVFSIDLSDGDGISSARGRTSSTGGSRRQF